MQELEKEEWSKWSCKLYSKGKEELILALTKETQYYNPSLIRSDGVPSVPLCEIDKTAATDQTRFLPI
jgi:hypothetical protein